MASEKTCFKCLSVKPLDEFYRHPFMADGHLNKCKECTKRDANEHRQRNLERIREYDKLRSALPHRKEQLRELQRRGVALGRVRASVAVGRAIRKGTIRKQPCHVCGAEKAEAHHTHYSHPLEVVWLCRSHHVQLHRQFSLWSKKAA
jgi:DNA repair exonuclease SbcCD ATPase subunit